MDRAALISPEYQQQLREMHARADLRWGAGGHQYAQVVVWLAGKLRAKSILDYGCGLGTLKESIDWLDVREYDPGIVGKDVLPAPADLVVCTDVLEHIERDKLDAVLEHLCQLTRKLCLASIATRPANAILPDGRNAHLIVKDAKFWLAFLGTKDWTVEIAERNEDLLIVYLRK